MVDESEYRLPHPQPEQQQTDESSKEDTIKKLEQLPWSPHGDVW
jgi:hypothetical protein